MMGMLSGNMITCLAIKILVSNEEKANKSIIVK